MKLGGFCPLPWKLGGGVPRVQTLYESLNQARGSAYDTSDSSNVTAETMAHARSLECVWSANRRLACAADPKRLPAELLGRWEDILDLHPAPGDTDFDRRNAIHAKFLAWIGPSALQDICTTILGDTFVSLVFTTLADAYQRWPENGFPDDWTSSTAHILVRVQTETNQTEAEFWNLMASLGRTLDDFLPAWATWDWGTLNEGATEGFYLDDPVGAGPPPTNLNFETFDA